MSLSPVLRTLTAATSSDSIWALSAILFILNALLGDYSSRKFVGQVRETWVPCQDSCGIHKHEHCNVRLTSVLSMNAAISSSVVLASRLSNDLAVFSLILFSVQTFALFPMLRHRVEVPARVPTLLNNELTCFHLVRPYPYNSAANFDCPPLDTINFTHCVLVLDYNLCSFDLVDFCYLPRSCRAGLGSKV